MQDIDWNRLLDVDEFSSLRGLGFDFVQIAPDLYRIADSAFAYAVKSYKGNSVDGPFVSQFYWASSIGAARRAALRELEADELVLGTPPTELLPDNESTTFGDLLVLAKAEPKGVFSSGFLYRPSSIGSKCVGRYIALRKLTFYFRTCKVHGDDEPLFAISIDLRRLRWAKAGK